VPSSSSSDTPLSASFDSPVQETLLDPALNFFPSETVRHIHFMGICGTGMGALAGMFKDSGFKVTGSDANVYPPMSDFLAGLGIAVHVGYVPENLTPRPDLVVVGNVITRKNPEAVGLAAFGIPYVSFPQALSHFFLAQKFPLVVAGTHGKTTTSSMLATMLAGAGMSPGFMIGGIVQAFGRNYNIGSGDYFVVEGDEYDTAFFDKGPKFLHYRPKIAVVTSIEFDHADIYQDLEAVKNAFKRLVAIMPSDGCLVACLDDPVVSEIVAGAPCDVLGYGQATGLDWSLAGLKVTPQGTYFHAFKNGELFGSFISNMPGRHNGLNSLAVIAVMDRLGVDRHMIARELINFKGVRRRQEVRGVVRGVTVIDDFAHHPTAVRETLEALKEAYAGQRLIAVFDPRTNTTRRKVFQEAYVGSFGSADRVLVKEPEPLKNVAPEELFSSSRLAEDLRARGIDASYFPSADMILDDLAVASKVGDVVAFLSNGGFDNIHARFLERLRAAIPGQTEEH